VSKGGKGVGGLGLGVEDWAGFGEGVGFFWVVRCVCVEYYWFLGRKDIVDQYSGELLVTLFRRMVKYLNDTMNMSPIDQFKSRRLVAITLQSQGGKGHL
jgi:hypothetical protein